MRIRLRTARGALVAEFDQIPPFITPPDVVIWGTRHFTAGAVENRPNGFSEYNECFAYAIVSPPNERVADAGEAMIAAEKPVEVITQAMIDAVPKLQFFRYSHLNTGPMRDVSKAFAELALKVAAPEGTLNQTAGATSISSTSVWPLPANEQRDLALQNLLEAKDCAVRALIYK